MKVIEIEGFKELETTFLKELKKRRLETKPKRKRKASPIKKLVISTEESKELIKTGWIEINRNGFTLTLEKNNDFDSSQEESDIFKKIEFQINITLYENGMQTKTKTHLYKLLSGAIVKEGF